MGALTKAVEKGLGSVRRIIPMGKRETSKRYPDRAKYSDVVKDVGMDPTRVDIISDGEEVDPYDEIGNDKDITIMPKQKGGSGFDLSESVAAVALGVLVDPQGKDKKLWDDINKRLDEVEI